MFFRKKRIYLDYAGATPIDPRVQKKVSKIERDVYANSSAIHADGKKAMQILQSARVRVARIAQVQEEEVFFTASGTEANNLAILGVVKSYTGKGLPHIVTSSIEHSSVLEVCRYLEKKGEARITYVSPDEKGLIRPQEITRVLSPETVLVSVMYVNNEIGVIEPVASISREVASYRKKMGTVYPYVHTDASQAPCYLDIHMQALGVDMMTIDSLKIYGPRGCGVLYKKRKVILDPIIYGGGQERGLRSGTENIPAIAGCAEALFIAKSERKKEVVRLKKIQEYLFSSIQKNIPSAEINGDSEQGIVNNVNICFPGIDAEFAVIVLDQAGISCSYSSSCQTQAGNASSYVIEAIGKYACTASSIRVTFGRYTKKSDIDVFVRVVKRIVLENDQ